MSTAANSQSTLSSVHTQTQQLPIGWLRPNQLVEREAVGKQRNPPALARILDLAWLWSDLAVEHMPSTVT